MTDFRQFFGHYFQGLRADEYIHLRAFKRPEGTVWQRWAATPEEAEQLLQTLDLDRYDIYFGTTTRRNSVGTKSGVQRIYALWADMDFKHFGGSEERARKVLDSLELPPSLVINSGGGYQVYWSLPEPVEATPQNTIYAEYLMERLYYRLGGLDKVQDLSRIMRVPGTKNLKVEYADTPTVRVVEVRERRYTLADFERVLPYLPTAAHTTVRNVETTPGRIPSEQEIRELLAHVPKQMDYRDWLAVCLAVHSVYPDERGAALVSEWSPRLDPEGQDITAEWWEQTQSNNVTLGTLYHHALQNGWEGSGNGPVIRLVRDGQPVRNRVKRETSAEWQRMLDDYPALSPEEMPYYLRRQHDYLEPLMKPFESDWSEMMSLAFYSSQWGRVRFENLNLGIWFLGLAEQGVGKSAGQKELQDIYQDIAYARELDMPLFTSGTTRGLENKLAGEDKQALGVFDEYVGMLKSMNTEHTSGMKETMCKLYDGSSFAHVKAEETISGTNPFLVISATTTPDAFKDNAKREDMVNGYLSRKMFCAPNVYRLQPDFTPRYTERNALVEELLSHIQAHSHVRYAAFNSPKGVMPGVLQEWVQAVGLNTGALKTIEETLGQEITIPWGRVLARIKKLATLLELSEREPNVVDNIVYVHERNVALAIRLAHRAAAYHLRVIALMTQGRDEAALAKILKVLEKRGRLSAREVMQHTHLDQNPVRAGLALLFEEGRVTKTTEGRKEVFWLTKEAA